MNDLKKYTKKACIQCGLSPQNILMLACDHSVCLECAYRQIFRLSTTIASQFEFKCRICGEVTYFDQDLIRQIQSGIHRQADPIKIYKASGNQYIPSGNQCFTPSDNQTSIKIPQTDKHQIALSNPGFYFGNLNKNYKTTGKEESVIQKMKKQYFSQSTTVGNSYNQSPMSIKLQGKQQISGNNPLQLKRYLEMTKISQKTTPEKTNKMPANLTIFHKQRNELSQNKTELPAVKVPEPKQVEINQTRTPSNSCKMRSEHSQFPGREETRNFNTIKAECDDGMCQDHRLYELNYFCSTCSQIVCSECLLRGQHKDHQNLSLLQTIHEQLPYFISETSSILLSRVEHIQSKKHCQNAVAREMAQEVSNLKDQTLNLLRDLKKRIQKEEQQVISYCQALLNKIAHEDHQSENENRFRQREDQDRIFQLISEIKELKTQYQNVVDLSAFEKNTQMPKYPETMNIIHRQQQQVAQVLDPQNIKQQHASFKTRNCLPIMQKYAHCRREVKSLLIKNSQNIKLQSASHSKDKVQKPRNLKQSDVDELKFKIYHLLLSVKQGLLQTFQFWPKQSPKLIVQQFPQINAKSKYLANKLKSQSQNQFDNRKYSTGQPNSDINNFEFSGGCTNYDHEQPKQRSNSKNSTQHNKQNLSTENNSRSHSLIDTQSNSQINPKENLLVQGNPHLLQKSFKKQEKFTKKVLNDSKSHSKSKSKLNSVSKSKMKEVSRKINSKQRYQKKPPTITKFNY